MFASNVLDDNDKNDNSHYDKIRARLTVCSRIHFFSKSADLAKHELFSGRILFRQTTQICNSTKTSWGIFHDPETVCRFCHTRCVPRWLWYLLYQKVLHTCMGHPYWRHSARFVIVELVTNTMHTRHHCCIHATTANGSTRTVIERLKVKTCVHYLNQITALLIWRIQSLSKATLKLWWRSKQTFFEMRFQQKHTQSLSVSVSLSVSLSHRWRVLPNQYIRSSLVWTDKSAQTRARRQQQPTSKAIKQ